MATFLQNLGLPTTSVGRKVAISVALPAILALVLGVALLWRQALNGARADAQEEASALADLVATSFTLATPNSPEPHAATRAALHTDWKLLGSVKGVRVADRAGTVRWSRAPEEQGKPLAGFDPKLLDDPRGTFAGDRFVLPIGGTSCAACHQGDSLHLGAVELQLAQPHLLTAIDDSYRFAMGGTVVLSLVFLGAVVYAMRRYVTRPVLRLAQAMDRARSGDFLVRVPKESDDEIGHLAANFNATLARITEMKVAEIETSHQVAQLEREVSLKAELEKANGRLEGRIRELQLLFELTRSFNSTLELEACLNLISDLVGKALGCTEFSVMLLDEAGRDLVHQAGFGDVQLIKGEVRFAVGEGVAGQAAAARQEIVIDDVEQDPRFVRRAGEKGALIAAPMVFKDQLVGVLNFRKPQVAGFGPDEVRLLMSVANQAAMAIVNARLFQKTVELSITDGLTGTFNRRHLFTRLEMEVHRAQRFGHPLGVVMIDVDHFKHFNDTCGHPAGDEVLRRAAALFKAQLRKLDVLARYGGEEFFVVLPQTTKDEAFEVAEKLRRAVERTAFPDGDKQPGGRVTISVGVASFPEDAAVLEKLVDCVDSALYASKRGGRNKVSQFAPGMEDHPGRERGPKAKSKSTEIAVVTAADALRRAEEEAK